MADLNYSCEKKPAVTYSLRGKGWWANITIREWTRGGSIDVHSDYGDYAYSWSHIGDQSLRAFLLELDMDYFMTKAKGHSYLMLSAEKTIMEIRKHILEMRRDGSLEKDTARRVWNALKRADDFHVESGLDFSMGDAWEDLAYKVYEGPYDIPFIKVPNYDATNFWNIVWPCACDVWRKELNGEGV